MVAGTSALISVDQRLLTMLTVTILSSHDVLFSGQAHHAVFPGEQGVFEVLPFHRPLVSRLLPGIILIDEQFVPIQRGVVKVESDSITAIVEPELRDGPPTPDR